MQYFIVFVVGAMLLGAGAMLSPAWPTRQPRIGTSAVFMLALIVGGAVFWAELFGWDTLVIDYLLFALVSIVVLGGTFSQAQERAEERGEELLDADQGWPGPLDLIFFAGAAVVCVLPLMQLQLPGGSLAIEHAAITLAAREGGTFTSLAPFFPEITVQAAPGYYALTAYLSQQLNQSIPLVHLSVGAVVLFLTVWASYDLGAELRNKQLGRAFAVMALLPVWWVTLFTAGYVAWQMAFVFGLAGLLYTVRYQRQQNWLDVVGAGLLLGAALYTHVGVFVGLLVLLTGFVVVTLFLPGSGNAAGDPSDGRWKAITGLLFGIPGVALLGTAPWWGNNLALVQTLLTEAVTFDMTGSGAVRVVLLLAGLIAGGVALWWLYQQLPDVLRRYIYVPVLAAALLTVWWVPGQMVLPDIAPLRYPDADDIAVLGDVRQRTEADARLINSRADAWAFPLAERETAWFYLDEPQLLHGMTRTPAPWAQTWQQTQPAGDARPVYVFLPDEPLPAEAADTLTAAFRQGESVVYTWPDVAAAVDESAATGE
jgi:hypothetical protein